MRKQKLSTEYDKNGNCIKIVSHNYLEENKYDEYNNLIYSKRTKISSNKTLVHEKYIKYNYPFNTPREESGTYEDGTRYTIKYLYDLSDNLIHCENI